MKFSNLGLLVGVALVAIAGLLVVLAERNRPPEQNSAPAALNRRHPSYRMFVSLGCLRCHGPDLAGTHKGPALGNLAARWNPQQLQRFLRDPQSFRDTDERLHALSAQYLEFEMPAYELVDSVLIDLSSFLLSPGEEP